MPGEAATPLPPGATRADGFGTTSLSLSGETAASGAVAQAQAAVQARYIVAFQRPRNWDRVRQKILRECQRPSFAEVARFKVPRGEGIEGPSIRFVEAMLRAMENIWVDESVRSDDAQKRIISVSVTDLETNVTYPREVVVEKTVERKIYKGDMEGVRTRRNYYGETLYIVPATEDDLTMKEGAAISKAIRTCGLRLVPGDLVDECMDVVEMTVADKTAEDPDAVRKSVVSGFARLNVPVDQLADYLGHSLDSASPAELAELREVYVTIDQGEASWRELVDLKAEERGDDAAAKRATTRREKLAKAAEKLRREARESADANAGADAPPEAAA